MLEATDLWAAPPGAPDDTVRGVSLRLERGAWVGLAGPNGSGKTTLLLALGGLWPSRRGVLRLDGERWGPEAPAERRTRVAVVLQEPGAQLVSPTVRDELEFGLVNLGWPESRRRTSVERWASAFELAPLFRRDPLTLSAGEQQRLLIAAALASEPGLLLCDEGGAHLDSRWRARVLDAVAGEVAARGMAVMWASQEPTELGRADRVLTLRDGTLVAEGAAAPVTPTALPPRGATVGRVSVAPPEAESGPVIRVGERLEFRVTESGVTAVTGPNGSGKSLLLASLAGLEDSPQVTLAWQRLPAWAAAYAGQYPELQIFADTAGQEICFGPLRRGCAVADVRRRLDPWLRGLGYVPEAFLARRTWSLSAGERRLLTLAGALLSPAGLLALDEPTVGLDRQRAAVVASWVAERSREVPTLVATQDLEWTARLAASSVTLGGAEGGCHAASAAR
jgi:energy-coupling factor transport system ATP-binding protein